MSERSYNSVLDRGCDQPNLSPKFFLLIAKESRLEWPVFVIICMRFLGPNGNGRD